MFKLIKSSKRLFTIARPGTFKNLSKVNFAQKNNQCIHTLRSSYLFNKIQMNFSSYPKHTKIELPSLSPTMAKGNIEKWNFKEGDQLNAGDVLCEVETDKSTVGFEVQESFILAKILLPAGTHGIEIGQQIAIGVSKKADVEAFMNYSPDSKAQEPVTQATPAPLKDTQQPQSTQNQQQSSKQYPKHTKLDMPGLSPTMEKGKILKWNYKAGDLVKTGDFICEIETDKSALGFEMQEESYIAKILVQENTEIKVGQLIAIMVSKAEYVSDFADYTGESKSESKSQQNVVKEQSQEQTQQVSQSSQSGSKTFASPLAKKTANEQNVNLNQIQGSGPNGRILQQDVLNQFSKPQETKSVETQPQEDKKQAPQQITIKTDTKNPYFDTPCSNMRKTIASRLEKSKATIPHFYVSADLEMDKLIKLREEVNAKSDIRVSINDFMIKASALALMDFKGVNSQWHEEFIRTFQNADISVAVTTEKGLITPIIFNSQNKSILAISQDMKSLAKKAKENKLQAHEYTGGTFTISNLGMYGVDSFTAIINPPQAAILAVSRIKKTIQLDETNKDKPYRISSQMNVTLSLDHKVIDGALAAEFLQKLRYYVENPIHLLIK